MKSILPAFPVNIAELKAGLRAYSDTREIITAFRRCITQSPNRSIGRLPAELVELIKHHTFQIIHQWQLHKWTSMVRYASRRKARPFNIEYCIIMSCGPAVRKAMRELVDNFSTRHCKGCRWIKRKVYGLPCPACQTYLSWGVKDERSSGLDPYGEMAKRKLILEDTQLDGMITYDPLTQHPTSDKLKAMLRDRKVLKDVRRAFADAWNTLLKAGTIITAREREDL